MASAIHPDTPAGQCGRFTTATEFRSWSKSVFNPDRWRRGSPPQRVIRAQRHKTQCAAGPGHRKAMRHIWRRDKRRFYQHRRAELWRVRVTPFPGPGGTWWSTPYPLVLCESGADYGKPYGAYSILDPAWREWGGRTAHAGEASKREQDLVAHHGWLLYGESAWECGSDGAVHPERF